MPIPTAAALKTIVTNNLASLTSAPYQYFLNDLISRGNVGTAVSSYRLTVANVPITSFDVLVTAMGTSNVVITPSFRNKDNLFLQILYSDIVVSLNNFCTADQEFTKAFGVDPTRIAVDLWYQADGDMTLPLKIARIALVTQ